MMELGIGACRKYLTAPEPKIETIYKEVQSDGFGRKNPALS
jgi:hypothetical protein